MEQTYNISLFTENSIGILNRITIIFTRRHLNIESITASECEIQGVFRYTIVLNTTEEQVIKVVNQIEKQVDVLKAFYHTDADVVYQEMALYKIPTNLNSGEEMELILRQHHARILSLSPEFTTIEKTGRPEEIKSLFDALSNYGVLEFAKSGRVAISKPMKTLEDYLKDMSVEM